MAVQVISFRCVLKNQLGRLISSTVNLNVLNDASQGGDFLKGLVAGLIGVHKGEIRRIALRAEEAYGFYDPRKVIQHSRASLDESAELKTGDSVMVADRSGRRGKFQITELYDDFVVLDGNHPLAGQDLVFEIEVLDARDATHEELAEAESPDSAPSTWH